MNSLVSLLRDCRGRIKILLVASSNGYDRVGGKFPQELQDSVEDDLGSDWFLEPRARPVMEISNNPKDQLGISLPLKRLLPKLSCPILNQQTNSL